jgi:urea transport system ATP-binding protein
MLEVEDLHAGYGTVPVLAGVSLRVQEGSFTGILGHNGMGKTTLLKTLIGILPASAGRIRLAGEDVTREPSHLRARRGLGYVPQGREIFPALSVRDSLRFAAAAQGRPEPTALAEVLAEFPRLEPLLERPGGALSGGEQQLLALARCLIQEPRLVLLDEPTEGIQPSVIKDIGRAIIFLRQRGDMAILLVEQYLDFAHELADDFAVMDRGEIVMSGTRETFDTEAVRRHMTV